MEVAPYADMAWKSRAPQQCRFFAWLAGRNRCWTSDRLARRGLPHQASCPFYDQAEETLNHILLGCVLARTVWHHVLTALGKPEWAPTAERKLVDWCNSCASTSPRGKDIRTILSLVMWELWKHRNAVVFDSAAPSVKAVIDRVVSEGRAWKTAGLLKIDLGSFLGSLARWAIGSS